MFARKRPTETFQLRVTASLPSFGTASASSCISAKKPRVPGALNLSSTNFFSPSKALPPGTRPTVTALSQRLCLRHHSTVELVDRLVEHGAVRRRHSDQDRREVLIELTPHGEELLHQLSVLHWEELRVSGPALSEALWAVVHHSGQKHRRRQA